MIPIPDIANISLRDWIDFTNAIKPYEERHLQLIESPECHRRDILLTKNSVDKAYCAYGFFDKEVVPYVDDVLKWYRELMEAIERVSPIDIVLPLFEDITFGQFVDSKMITSNTEKSRWELMPYIIAIYCNGEYHHKFTDENGVQFNYAMEIPLKHVIFVSDWFNNLNETINSNYTVFQDSGDDEKPNMKEHMQRWGWINFLKSIAKTKVFDIAGSGLNSIDCARAASLDDVLNWASEERDYNIALSRDMEIK